jgi:tetratricopeptide (TPR) repeat protein
MFRRLRSCFLLAALVSVGPVMAAAQTFGLDSDAAARAARAPADWVRQAQALERRGDWAALLAWGREWAAADATNPLAWFVQGRALGELGRLDEAIAAYRQNLRLVPGDVWARNNLGNAYRDHGRPRDAMQAYRAAVEADQDYFPAWHNLGLTFYRLKGQAGVVEALQRLHAVDPKLAEAWRVLAVAYSLTGDARLADEAARVLRGLNAAERSRMLAILFAEG